MPAVTVDDLLVLPRLPARLDTSDSRARKVKQVVTAHEQLEGAGFSIYRPFPGTLTMREADPFLLLDQVGPRINGPRETAGAPWHPHRGFETVSYVLDSEIAHHDTNGGGGVIGEGDTQWMTAGAGILHDELPTERAWKLGGPVHAVQLWVNLPRALKFTPPRYQAIEARHLTLVTSADGGALVRVIAGEVAGHAGPGSTHTPITYLHATIAAGAELHLPWNRSFNAMVFALTGAGTVGVERWPIAAHQLAQFGDGDSVVIHGDRGGQPLDVLVLGGMPIAEPIEHYGPFVMNDRQEIRTAIEDFQSGRLGIIPADQIAPRNYA